MHWCSPYVGLPWRDRGRGRDGIDCWGLVRLVYADLLGVALPSYLEAYEDGSVSAKAAIFEHTGAPPWVRATRQREYDLVVFRFGRYDAHVGVATGARQFLHIAEGQSASVASIDSRMWRERVSGIYRHSEVMARAR